LDAMVLFFFFLAVKTTKEVPASSQTQLHASILWRQASPTFWNSLR